MTHRAVVVHLDNASVSMYQRALTNIKHLLEELSDVAVELVVQGDALPMVMRKKSTVASDMQLLQDRGIQVMVCHRSMVNANVSAQDLLPQMVIVPSAIAHLVQRQQEGFAYVKP